MYQRHRKGACERCGGGPDHVHHKDRDRGNGDPSNLETLCAACHLAEHRASWFADRGLSEADKKRARFELRCSAAELERWRAVAGDVALGRWIRVACNDLALRSTEYSPATGGWVVPEASDASREEGGYARVVGGEAVGSPVADVADRGAVGVGNRGAVVVAARQFKPDFGSRLKPDGGKKS